MRWRLCVCVKTGRGFFCRKDLIDRVQDLPRGAKREKQVHRVPCFTCTFYLCREVGFHLCKLCGVRPLERKDGLFFVPHCEDGSGQFACPFAGQELFGQGLYDFPLVWARVLGFIHKDVVKATIELIENPGGG